MDKKNILFVAGGVLAGYGFYLWLSKKAKPDFCSGKNKSSGKPGIVKRDQPLYSDKALTTFDTNWHSLFPTPKPGHLYQGPLPLEDTDTFKSQL